MNDAADRANFPIYKNLFAPFPPRFEGVHHTQNERNRAAISPYALLICSSPSATLTDRSTSSLIPCCVRGPTISVWGCLHAARCSALSFCSVARSFSDWSFRSTLLCRRKRLHFSALIHAVSSSSTAEFHPSKHPEHKSLSIVISASACGISLRAPAVSPFFPLGISA